MLLVLVFTLILAFMDAWFDYRNIAVGAEVDHRTGLITRGLFISGIALVAATSPFHFIQLFILSCSVFWFVFELALNHMRSKSFLYVGYTSEMDKLTRSIFTRSPEISLFIIKVICLTISIGLYYVGNW